MILRRLCSVVALGALIFSSGCCCWHRHRCNCCDRPILFPRIREARWERGCSECGCATCCHSGEFMGPPVATTVEPTIAPLPMPRAATMKPGN